MIIRDAIGEVAILSGAIQSYILMFFEFIILVISFFIIFIFLKLVLYFLNHNIFHFLFGFYFDL